MSYINQSQYKDEGKDLSPSPLAVIKENDDIELAVGTNSNVQKMIRQFSARGDVDADKEEK